MTELIQQILNGLAAGAIYVLIASGITIIYGLTGTVNFAQGAMVTLGGYVVFALASAGAAFYVCGLAAMAALAVFGALLALVVFSRTTNRPITGFVVSLGLIAVIEAVLIQIYTTDTRNVNEPFHGVFHIGSVVLPRQSAFTIGVCAVVVGALFLFLTRTRTGRVLRAFAEDREMAEAMGANTQHLVILTFALGSALAGVAGALVVWLYPLTPSIGTQYVFDGFAIALIGGLGSVTGAALAGMTLGIVEAVLTSYVSSTWRDAYVLLIMIVVLMIRPTGLRRGTEGSSLL
jgi:branched-chain amino acid transport system permease protein